MFVKGEVISVKTLLAGHVNIYHFKRFHILTSLSLRWRHNGCDSISNHQPHHCLLNRLFRRRSKKTSKLRVTGLCAGNSPRTGEFPAQMACIAENVSIWWRHYVACSATPTRAAIAGDGVNSLTLIMANSRGICLNRPPANRYL